MFADIAIFDHKIACTQSLIFLHRDTYDGGTPSNIAIYTLRNDHIKFHALVHSVTILHKKHYFPLDYMGKVHVRGITTLLDSDCYLAM